MANLGERINGDQNLENKNIFTFSQKIMFMYLLVFIFGLGFGMKASAAVGDITAVRISDKDAYSGWTAEVDISGLSTGGTYNFGLGVNNEPSNAKMTFTVISQGYDDAGNTTTITRTIYGTNYVRKIYPNDAQANETDNGGSVTVLVALSDYIYSSDIVTGTISSSFYTQGSDNNAVTNLAVVNNSAEAYPKVIANWSYPGYSRIAGSSFTLSSVAFHRSAQQGRPVRAVKYTCADTHSNTVTTTVTVPSIDETINDAVKVVEYVGTISTETLTNGDTLTCNFQAYPWYGDSNSVLNTGDGVNAMPTPLYAPQYYLLDKDNTYGVTIAVVDSVAGNNDTGVAVDYASFDSLNPPAAFLNIYAAANAIAAYNNTNHSRNNTGAGVIYLKEGSHIWTGGTVTAGGQSLSIPWLTVTKFPGTTRANVLISSASGTKQINEHLKLEDVKITNSTTIGFNNMDTVWVHNSDVAPTGLATFYINTILYITNSQIWNNDELQTYSIENAARALIRGNSTMTALTTGIQPAYTVIGNDFDFSGSVAISGDYNGQTVPVVSNAIYAFNFISQFSSTGAIIGPLNSSIANAFGTAIVQNILERATGTVTVVMQVAADGSTSNPVNNILIWNNSIIGQRLNMAYNDYALNDIGPAYRKSWSVKNNIFDDYNSVTDIDAHGGTPNASRYGNHSVIHGAGFSGDVFLERTGAGGYTNKFSGLNSVLGSSLNPQYVNDKSVLGSGIGNGDYHLTASSPALNLISSGQALLPYDIDGDLRHDNGFGASGAYEWDIVAPTVTAFATPSTATSLIVSVSSFTAIDGVGVTGYKLTESSVVPAYDDSGWFDSAPALYTFSSAGAKTLYAWSKDAVGNISESQNASVIITLPASEDVSYNTDRNLNINSVKYTSTENSITIEWETNNNADEQIRYGTNKEMNKEKEDDDKSKDHKMTLKNLEPDTTYYFRIKSEDANESVDRSKTYEVKTDKIKTSQSSSNNIIKTGSSNSGTEDDSNLITKREYQPFDSSKANLGDGETPIKKIKEFFTAKIFKKENKTILSEVKFKILDKAGNFIPNLPVTIHSEPQETITDENGIATFKDIPTGDHTLKFAYDNNNFSKKVAISKPKTETGQVSIEVVEIIAEKDALPVWNIILIVGLIVILLVVVLYKRKKA